MNSQVMSSGPTTYGTNITLTCLHGYWFVRDVFAMTLVCEADGNWTGFIYSSCTRRHTIKYEAIHQRNATMKFSIDEFCLMQYSV